MLGKGGGRKGRSPGSRWERAGEGVAVGLWQKREMLL